MHSRCGVAAMERNVNPNPIKLVSPTPIYPISNGVCGLLSPSKNSSPSSTRSPATSRSVPSTRSPTQEPPAAAEHHDHHGPEDKYPSINSDVAIRASHNHNHKLIPIPGDETRLHTITVKVKPSLHKWFRIIDALIRFEADRSIMVPPHIHFDDIPWPVKGASKVLGAFPLTRAMEAEIKEMLSMGSQRGYHSQIQFNMLVWGYLDFEKRVLPLVLPSDRKWVWSAKKQISRAIGYSIQEDILGEHPFLRPRQVSAQRIKMFANKACQLSDPRDPDRESVFDF